MCGHSLVVASRDYSLAVVHGLLMAEAYLLVEHTGSVVVGNGLSCPTACGIFQDLYHLHRQVDSQPLDHQGSLSVKTCLGCLCIKPLGQRDAMRSSSMKESQGTGAYLHSHHPLSLQLATDWQAPLLSSWAPRLKAILVLSVKLYFS